MLQHIEQQFDHRPPFRIAETPVFIPQDLLKKLMEACEELNEVIIRPDFKALSQGALLEGQSVPNETDHTLFLQMDFAVTLDADGQYSPQLIEAQGFPSLYFYQHMVADIYRQFYQIPDHYVHLFNQMTSDEYMELLRRNIVGDHDPKNVILLEVEPFKQATLIDFLAARKALGIEILCVSDIKKEGRDLYYLDKNGKKVGIERIFNRVIFDELIRRDDLPRECHLSQDDVDVTWAGHPNWFFRISKHTLPLFKSQYVPPCHFLNELDEYPEDLENYVLKPLYSFSGSGVMININKYDLDAVKNPEHYILQKKVEYAPVIQTPNQASKCEIRMLMIWEPGAPRPVVINNLARLSKGEMIGVKYNKNKDWVGGTVGFFEPLN